MPAKKPAPPLLPCTMNGCYCQCGTDDSSDTRCADNRHCGNHLAGCHWSCWLR
jgi:hypothetical protein